MKRHISVTKRIATDAIFTSLSLITFIIESLFPPLFIPGAKMGLSNIFSFAALVMYSPLDAFIVIAVRTFLGSLYAGSISSMMYSFTAGMVAMAISAILMYVVYPKMSIIAISIVAAVAHNIVQILVCSLISMTSSIFVYMPYLALIGVLSGAIVGGVVMLIFKKVPISVYQKAINR